MTISREQAYRLEHTPVQVIAPCGERVGWLRHICLDAETEQPAWVSVDIGASGILETLVPLEGTTVLNDALRVAYDRDTIHDAPRVEDGDNLWPGEESALCAYYMLPQVKPAADPTLAGLASRWTANAGVPQARGGLMPARAGKGPDLPHRRKVGNGDRPQGSCAAARDPTGAPPPREAQMALQDPDTMARFRQDYLSMLECRVARIHHYLTAEQGLTAEQRESAYVALISLWSSSAMVGADRLVAAVASLRPALAAGTTTELQPLLQQLDREVAAVQTALDG